METTIESSLLEAGFTPEGVNKFIRTIESVMPHMPGNWVFLNTNDKLFWISRHNQIITEYLEKAKPEYEDWEPGNALEFFSDPERCTKARRLNDIQSAESTIRSYCFERN